MKTFIVMMACALCGAVAMAQSTGTVNNKKNSGTMKTTENLTQHNKAVVVRFNKEVIEQSSSESFLALVDKEFINRTAAPGTPNGPDGMLYFFTQILKAGISDIKVEILDQVAEGDKVTTRKTITGTHTGTFMGIPATGKKVVINVIDIVRLRDGKYIEHWGSNDLPSVLAQLQAK